MNSVVTIADLPLRPKKLTNDDLKGVFGGCKANGTTGCSSNKDCCSGKCYGVVSTMKWSAIQLGQQAPFTKDDFGTTKCTA